MRIDVVGRNIEVTDAIRQYAESRGAKLPRFFDGVQQVIVTLTQTNAHHTTAFNAEFVVEAEKHKPFVSNAESPDLYAAIDLSVEKTERQLRDFKERLKKSHH